MHIHNYEIEEVEENIPIYDGEYLSTDTTTLEQMEDWVISFLKEYIYFGVNYWQCSDTARMLMLLEAANWAAKTVDPIYYTMKENLSFFILTNVKDVLTWTSGWVAYYYHPEVGTVSCHYPDSFEDIERCVQHPEMATFEWSGITRQDMAWEIIEREDVRKAYAYGTRPRSLWDASVYKKFDEMMKAAGF